MKISINSQFISGSYGGGMQFAKYLKQYLEEQGDVVINHLDDDDIDIILHVNPFPELTRASAFSFWKAYKYKLTHPKTIIIQRVNECDQRKNTHYMNKLLGKCSYYSDYIVFVSSWLKKELEGFIDHTKPSTVIENGADSTVFNTKNKKIRASRSPLRIVTHHWSDNYLKGHDVYQRLDEFLNDKEIQKHFMFTYIGNYPKKLNYKNTQILSPLSGKALADELKKHDVYLTASRNEPAGMHIIEGALCGLPMLYINSGSMPEYCRGFGVAFNTNNFEKKLWEMKKRFRELNSKMKNYNKTAERMCTTYYQLFSVLQRNSSKYEVDFAPMQLVKFHFDQFYQSLLLRVRRIIIKLSAKFL